MADRLSKGDLVLVTGASGLVGSSLADELLKRGFKVRGVTRNASKESLLQKKFDDDYGAGAFEWAEVPDVTKSGAYDAALGGVSGIIHAATEASLTPDYDKVVNTTVNMTIGILDSALRVPTVKSLVITSSCVAVFLPQYGPDVFAKLTDWNDAAADLAQQLPDDNPAKAFLVYTASKTRAERAVWKWVDEKKPHFAVNTILPMNILGPVVNPAPRVYSTSTWLNELFEGKTDGMMVMALNPPAWLIDVRDNAIIHIGALLAPDVDGQRLWAASHPISANRTLAIWREAFPSRQILPDFDFPPAPKIELDHSKSAELVRRYAGRDYLPAKQTLVENVQHLAA